MGGTRVKITYSDKGDLLYIRLDESQQSVLNRRVSDNVVPDLGENDRIVGIEIMNASRAVRLDRLLPVRTEGVA